MNKQKMRISELSERTTSEKHQSHKLINYKNISLFYLAITLISISIALKIMGAAALLADPVKGFIASIGIILFFIIFYTLSILLLQNTKLNAALKRLIAQNQTQKGSGKCQKTKL